MEKWKEVDEEYLTEQARKELGLPIRSPYHADRYPSDEEVEEVLEEPED